MRTFSTPAFYCVQNCACTLVFAMWEILLLSWTYREATFQRVYLQLAIFCSDGISEVLFAVKKQTKLNRRQNFQLVKTSRVCTISDFFAPTGFLKFHSRRRVVGFFLHLKAILGSRCVQCVLMFRVIFINFGLVILEKKVFAVDRTANVI
jgi:hypothetical protein